MHVTLSCQAKTKHLHGETGCRHETCMFYHIPHTDKNISSSRFWNSWWGVWVHLRSESSCRISSGVTCSTRRGHHTRDQGMESRHFPLTPSSKQPEFLSCRQEALQRPPISEKKNPVFSETSEKGAEILVKSEVALLLFWEIVKFSPRRQYKRVTTRTSSELDTMCGTLGE